jgi:hypothetical protein
VRRLVGAPRVSELTWAFDSPDGSATFELVRHEAGLLVPWRRIGTHSIVTAP